ncbi:MAG: helix-turn-helix transcriptional regulator [Chlorobi bacterium]|nr:helix-turn-helix transcriptional regulator [Chlorobiota bacterium]
METTILHIKNMVCDRCIRTVRSELEKLEWHVTHIELGKVHIEGHPEEEDMQLISKSLQAEGFDLIIDKETQLVEDIKARIIEHVHYTEDYPAGVSLSGYLADVLHHDYKFLSSLFSKHQESTIEKYYILQRIERVKELLSYDELTLSEIAWKTGFSSVHHLSAQFKKITGLTPSRFKENTSRKPLDTV